MSATPALVIPHTHWDRAWYWPAARLQVRLIECMRTLLAIFASDPEYRFSCDGQTLMIEDYLEACPEDRSVIQGLVRSGRLSVGPLYCQADLYCTGGEALIRNLLIGRSQANALGGVQHLLYMPDTFGITPAIPMICQGFGIDAVCFMRGLSGDLPGMFSMSADPNAGGIPRQIPAGTRMFRWSCPDGSEVRVFHLRDGYANACDIGRKPGDASMLAAFDLVSAQEKLLGAARKQDDAQGAPLLLLAGVDHQIPEPRLSEAMRAASASGAYVFRYAGFDDLLEAMRAHPREELIGYRGEFHGHGAASVLGGTVSTRIYLKHRNARAERLLIHQAEAAAALVLGAGVEDGTSAGLTVAWKHLLTTHPHDDICGCSVDAVHRDNEYHLAQAEIGGDAMRRRLIRRLVEAFGGVAPEETRFAFLVVSTQASRSRVRTVITLDFEARLRWGDYQLAPHYALVDERGREIPFRELRRGRSLEHPHEAVTLELYPVLEPFTLTRVFIEPRPAPASPAAPAGAAGDGAATIANAHLRARLDAHGLLTLTDLRGGTTWSGLGSFSGQADAGDSYDFADLDDASEEMLTLHGARCGHASAHAGLQVLELTGTLRLPLGLDEAASARLRELVELPVSVVYTLAEDAEHLECLVSCTNTARDHRLRWNLALPAVPTRSRAGLKFNEVTRTAPAQPSARPRVHPEHPADHFIAVEAAGSPSGAGLALYGECPLNYEIVHQPTPRLAVTILRAVGMLTRPGLGTRPSGAGPLTPTPEAQCLGRQVQLRFALRPFAGAAGEELFHGAARWRADPLVGQIEGYWPQHGPRGVQGPLLSCSGQVVVTACKPPQGNPTAPMGPLVRLFNPLPRSQTVILSVPAARRLSALGLDEEPTTQWALQALEAGRWQLTIPAYALRTVGLDAGLWQPGAVHPP
jgi:hypothetical protein